MSSAGVSYLALACTSCGMSLCPTMLESMLYMRTLHQMHEQQTHVNAV